MMKKSPIFSMVILLAAFGGALEAQAATYTLSVTATHGSVPLDPSGGTYEEGTKVKLIPKPDVGYCFTGWAGDARGKRLVLNLAMDSDKAITANFDPWQPPMGIPAPDFGISETHYMYVGETYDFGSGPEPYRDAGNGPYTHYVDNTHPNATNVNTYGTPEEPRLTVPQYLPAGSVVEVHGGPYQNEQGQGLNVWQGTSTKPIFVRGINKPESGGFALYNDNASWHNGSGGQYVIVEGFGLRGFTVTHSKNPPFYNHVALRNCEVYNPTENPALSGVIGIGNNINPNPVHDIVIYNNEIHNADTFWDDESLGDWDHHGIKPFGYANNIWILDNNMHHNGGDAVQIGDLRANPNLHHIYVGRNIAHDNRQTCFWAKSAEDVIFSENTAYSNGLSAMGMQYEPQRVWYLFNHVDDSHWGFHVGATIENLYFIGNVFTDIHDKQEYSPTNPHLASAAISVRRGSRLYAIGNTIYNVDAGIVSVTNAYYLVANNIIVNVDNGEESLDSKGMPVWFLDEGGSNNWNLDNNLFYNGSADPYVFRLSTTEYTLNEINNLYPTKSQGNIQADPLFINPANGDFRMQPSSPAGAAGISSEAVQQVYDTFQTLYDIDIRKDIEGTSLTEPWDIGAHKSENRAPVLALIGDQSVHVGSLLSLTLSATDADGDAITYSATGLPTGATLEGAAFSWTPEASQVGPHEITFIASDGSAQDSEVVTVTVSSTTNSAPVLAAIGSQAVGEGSLLSFSISATDIDGDPITYSATGLPTGATFSGATFSWTPGYDQAGPHEITFTASDGEAQDSEVVTVTVSNTNRAPVLASIADRAVDESSGLSFGISASDADGETLTYSATPMPSGASFAGQTFTWTPTYDQAGGFDVTFTATDGTAEDSETITITVDNVNRTPVLDVIASQAVDHSTLLTFDISATDPDGDTLSYSATGSPSGAVFSGQTFNWTPSLSQAGTYQVTFTVSDGHLTDSQAVTIAVSDALAPVVTNLAPAADSIQAPVNGLITLDIVDAGMGVDADSVTIALNGQTIYTGDTPDYTSAIGHCYRSGTAADYAYAYQTSEPFDFDEAMTVTVNAADLGGIEMTPYSYSFTTEMRAFGANRCVSWGPQESDKGSAATACDSQGNIWAVYHAGPVGQRDIYASKMAVGDSNFAGPTQLTSDSSDQSYPGIAIGADDKLYVVWQDHRGGNWDVYARTSANGTTWSAETRVSDPNNNQMAPAIAVDAQSPPNAHIAWQDDSAGHEDIYVARSSNDFATTTISRITSDVSDQTAPAIAIDASNMVYLVWTDDRNGLDDDIYGASSAGGPWTNVALITGAGDQYAPAIATEASGSVLHFAWADDAAGDNDIWYASSDPMPATPGSKINVVNDTSGADQLSPALITTGSTGNDLKVFVCWQDWRNFADGRDTDLYFVQVKTGADTNVLVGDGATGSDQSEPAIGVDLQGDPYVVWTDHRNATDEVYYAGSSVMDSDAVDSQVVIASVGGTVGVASPSAAGDVCVVIPAGACSYDFTISISEVQNPQALPSSSSSVVAYDFGPSGLEFNPPVTITIAYAVADFPDGPPEPYWYDSQTASLDQAGISNIETLEISTTVHAIRFQTTHFTPYYLLETVAASDGGGGGGGGCTLSPGGEGHFVEFLLPCLGIAAIMVALGRRDRRARHGTASNVQE